MGLLSRASEKPRHRVSPRRFNHKGTKTLIEKKPLTQRIEKFFFVSLCLCVLVLKFYGVGLGDGFGSCSEGGILAGFGDSGDECR